MATFSKYGQYSLTRPITKNSEAYYWTVMVHIYNGGIVNAQYVRNREGKYMTYQALREAKLIKVIDGNYQITPKGKEYVEYYKKASNPTETFFDQYQEKAVTLFIDELTNTPAIPVETKSRRVSNLGDIQTTSNLYKVEVKRTNGANVYVESYTFENEADANIAKNIMGKAENTSASLV